MPSKDNGKIYTGPAGWMLQSLFNANDNPEEYEKYKDWLINIEGFSPDTGYYNTITLYKAKMVFL